MGHGRVGFELATLCACRLDNRFGEVSGVATHIRRPDLQVGTLQVAAHHLYTQAKCKWASLRRPAHSDALPRKPLAERAARFPLFFTTCAESQRHLEAMLIRLASDVVLNVPNAGALIGCTTGGWFGHIGRWLYWNRLSRAVGISSAAGMAAAWLAGCVCSLASPTLRFRDPGDVSERGLATATRLLLCLPAEASRAPRYTCLALQRCSSS